MKNFDATIFKSKEELIEVANFLPYPFIIAEIENSSLKKIFLNGNATSEFGYFSSEIESLDDWYVKAFPNVDYRNKIRTRWEKKDLNARLNKDKYVKIKAKITSKDNNEKWYEVKAFIFKNLYVLAYVDINKEVILQKALKKVNQNNDRMLAILGHDLRSPIFNLALMSTLAAKSKVSNDEFISMVKIINKESHQVLEMLGTTLNWAKLNFNAIKIKKVAINYKELVENIVLSYKVFYENKNITVDINLDNFKTDKNDIEVISILIRNIFSNAIKYTAIGGKISFSHDNNQLIIQDSGIGMSSKKIESIENNKCKSTLGTINEFGMGMGLQIVMKLAKKINCQVFIESEPNVGTVVKITF